MFVFYTTSMYIYVRTPLYKNAKIVSHILEHCVGHRFLDDVDFPLYNYGMDAVLTPQYTVFEHEDRIDKNYFIQKIILPLQESDVIYEWSVLQKELAENDYDNMLYEYALNEITKHPINLNKLEKVSFSELKEYHTKYYTPENIVVTDKNWNIIDDASFLKSIQKVWPQSSFKIPIFYEEDHYTLIGYKNATSTGYWELFFQFWMINLYTTRIKRFQDWEYFFLEPYFWTFEDIVWLAIPDISLPPMSTSFFNYGKKYIIEMMNHAYFQKDFFLNSYFAQRHATRESVIEQYNTYSLDILNQIK